MVKKILNYNFLVVFIIVFLICSCKKKNNDKLQPIAKVYDTYLYLSDIQHVFHEKMPKDDSVSTAHSYINTWIKNQLLMSKAELNLTSDQLEVKQQIDAYRASLLIYIYEDQMIKQKLDTNVNDNEIEEYYKQNTSSFSLEDFIVKALYIKIPKSAPDIVNLKKWYKSNQREDYKKLESYCYNYGSKYNYFDDNWLEFNLIQRELPKHVEVSDEFFKLNKTIEQEDEGFFYFVYLKEYMSKGVFAPFDFIKPKVKDIILNKRKIKFLNDLENKIYSDAQDHNQIEIYNIENK
jgi:hypothetical protein